MKPALVLLLLLATAPAATGAAQASRAAALRPDSAAVLREARHAQRAFENERRARLRLDLDDGRGPCDVHIGRFCYWYRPREEPPEPEPDAVGRGRMLLLLTLDDAAARLPGDDWIAGQRVRYFAEHGWADSGVAAARECRGTRWWCAALEGFARHAAADYAGADSGFARALSAMPDAERCEWSDLSPLLADADARRYAGLACDERGPANDRIWWLARPFYSIAGHDLRTEHYSRVTMTRMLRHASSPHDLAWGDDLTQLVVRFGWPTHWTRPFGTPGRIEEPAALGHEPSPSFWFFAEPSLPPDTLDGEPWREPTWDPLRERPSSRYAPAYARVFGVIRAAQVARFRRDAGFLTIAGFDLRGDTAFTGAEPKVALAVARDPATPPVVGPALFPRSTGIIAVTSPWAPRIVSLEARVDQERRAARLRALADEPAEWLSDILLFVPGEELPESLGVALPLSVRANDVPEGGRVGLFWETYGEPAADSVTLEVKLVRVRGREEPRSALGRAACAPGGKAPVAVRWRDAAAPVGLRPRAVVADLSALEPGRYVVAVSVHPDGSRRACASRDLEVLPR
ncbi:MAG TPA: hypothetical protein VFU46_13165 [Gemmatimonadales bacterium]|nr:hypothetical protein [Gemmatimonadales bacterium]